MTSPNSQYQQQQGYFQPMPEARRRSSSYTADRYRPASYSSSPPVHQPDPSLLGPHQYGYPPSPMPAQPPYPVDYNPNSQMTVPTMAQHQLGAEMGYRRPSVTTYPDGLQRQSFDGRRPSQASRYSHRSERSHHSHHSHQSSHSQRPRDDDEDDYEDYDEDRRHSRRSHSRSQSRSHSHSHHHSHHDKDQLDDVDAYRQQKKDRGDNVSRSLGGSLLSVFGPLKYLLEPRDKY